MGRAAWHRPFHDPGSSHAQQPAADESPDPPLAARVPLVSLPPPQRVRWQAQGSQRCLLQHGDSASGLPSGLRDQQQDVRFPCPLLLPFPSQQGRQDSLPPRQRLTQPQARDWLHHSRASRLVLSCLQGRPCNRLPFHPWPACLLHPRGDTGGCPHTGGAAPYPHTPGLCNDRNASPADFAGQRFVSKLGREAHAA